MDGELISQIGKGLLILAGIGKDDTIKDAESMAAKILKVKLWDDDDGGRWKKNVQDIDGEVLCGERDLLHRYTHRISNQDSNAVSQFTLYATTKKGNKPDFHKSAPAAKGKDLYDAFVGKTRSLYREDRVKDGVFQAMMDVGLVNDGPVSDGSESESEAHPEIPVTPRFGLDYTSMDEEVHGLGEAYQLSKYLLILASGHDTNRIESTRNGKPLRARRARRA